MDTTISHKYGVYNFGSDGQMLLSTSNKRALSYVEEYRQQEKKDKAGKLKLEENTKRVENSTKPHFRLGRFLLVTTMRIALIALVVSAYL